MRKELEDALDMVEESIDPWCECSKEFKLVKSTLEKLDTAWEIVKKHNGRVCGYKGKLDENNICVISMNDLTETEFNLLEEMLK